VFLKFDDKLIVTDQCDQEMRLLADRHYSRRPSSIGKAQFLYACRKIVIRNAEGTMLFAWGYPDETMRQDGQSGYNCVIFRNESSRRSSDIILECEAIAVERWGPNRFFTYVDPRKIKNQPGLKGGGNPGYCFKCAGWKKAGVSSRGLHLLVKEAFL